jgi:hypothetical protein
VVERKLVLAHREAVKFNADAVSFPKTGTGT